MSEHVHNWETGNYGGFAGAGCECDARLTETEIDKRLNATEKLSAEDALEAAGDGYLDNEYGEPQDWQDAARAYAAALEK